MKGYIYLDYLRKWESHFSLNPKWLEDYVPSEFDHWDIAGIVHKDNAEEDIYNILTSNGFDNEYINNFIMEYDRLIEILRES